MHDSDYETFQEAGYQDVAKRFLLPGAAWHIFEEGATFATGYAFDQITGKWDRFEDPAGWAYNESLRFCYRSNSPQLYRQLFVGGFLGVYPRAKKAFETKDYAIAPGLDRATQFWLFNQWAKDHSRDLALPAIAGALSEVQEAAS
jgi:hypothetical protein